MLFNRKECLKRFGTDYMTAKQVAEGKLFQIEKGLWAEQPSVPEQAILSFKYPNAVLTMLSAFYYYGLTDVIPEIFDLATDRDAAKIKDRRVHQVFMPSDFLNVGAETEKYQGYSIRIYNRERMLIELLRYKTSIPYDLYKEIILNYRKILPQLNMQKIQDYSIASPKSLAIMNALQTEVL